ncbi:NADH dehydrogenase 1 alpha subcomplex subunit 12 isoform 1 [Theobroma cacao]|uniref:NADH dehydrogenase [ubiquinone] 1 alpha subcomplex subunit 12 n=1 Tax=Theobroma cacao TaxID=3641 RepID=A0A061GUN5_THECC|nr:NADH dehydrogenase 1 alpha subcomplex subunit 12 isoform 1 [Theobroma cacao]
MASTVVKSALQAIREKGLRTFLRELKEDGYTKCIFDGNLLQTKIHNIGATLVGVDKFGNKYYEKLGDTQCGRHRWVEYAKKDRYDASQVPPEWHGWLHCITDHTGDELLMLKPKRYGVEHKENLSGGCRFGLRGHWTLSVGAAFVFVLNPSGKLQTVARSYQ